VIINGATGRMGTTQHMANLLVSVRRLPESFESFGRRRRDRLNRLDRL
jgi:hypothetical protein